MLTDIRTIIIGRGILNRYKKLAEKANQLYYCRQDELGLDSQPTTVSSIPSTVRVEKRTRRIVTRLCQGSYL